MVWKILACLHLQQATKGVLSGDLGLAWLLPFHLCQRVLLRLAWLLTGRRAHDGVRHPGAHHVRPLQEARWHRRQLCEKTQRMALSLLGLTDLTDLCGRRASGLGLGLTRTCALICACTLTIVAEL